MPSGHTVATKESSASTIRFISTVRIPIALPPCSPLDSAVVSVSWLRSPDVVDVRAALQRVAPSLADLHLAPRPHEKGGNPRYHSGTAALGEDYIAKYAWSEWAAARLWHEVQVLTLLNTTDPGLPVPRVVAWSSDPVLLVTSRVAGEWLGHAEASLLRGERLEQTAGDAARFLVRLHRPEVLRAVETAGLVVPEPEPQATTQALRERFGHFVDASRQQRVIQWCDWADDVLSGDSEVVLLHGDFAGHNMMWDAHSATVRLVYDFEESAAGDPAYDFRYLPSQAESLTLFRRVLEKYAADTGRHVPIERVMAWHLRTALGDALWRSEAGVPLPLDGTPVEWVDEVGRRLSELGFS